MCIAGNGCRWIAGEDFIERLRDGDDIFCGQPIARAGEAWCEIHRRLVYIDPEAAVVRVADLPLSDRRRYLTLRRSGFAHERTLEMVAAREREAKPAAA